MNGRLPQYVSLGNYSDHIFGQILSGSDTTTPTAKPFCFQGCPLVWTNASASLDANGGQA